MQSQRLNHPRGRTRDSVGALQSGSTWLDPIGLAPLERLLNAKFSIQALLCCGVLTAALARIPPNIEPRGTQRPEDLTPVLDESAENRKRIAAELHAKAAREPVYAPEESQRMFAARVRERAAKVEREIARDEVVVRAWMYVRREIPSDAEASAEYVPAGVDPSPYIGFVRGEAAAWKVRLCSRVFGCALDHKDKPVDELQQPIVTLWLHAGTGQLLKLTMEQPTLDRRSFRDWNANDYVEALRRVDRERWVDLAPEPKITLLEALGSSEMVGRMACDANRVIAHLVRRRTLTAGEQDVWAIEFVGIPPHGIGHGSQESQRYLRYVCDATTGESDWFSSAPGLAPDPRRNSVAPTKRPGERTWPDRESAAHKDAQQRGPNSKPLDEPDR